MHTKVDHFLNPGTHFYRMPFLWTPIMNNKTYQIENLKLIIHEQLDYENTYIIKKNKNTPTFHNGLLKYKNMNLSID